MQFLIDECLSPTLAQDAIDRGFVLSTHVVWRGLQGAPDWRICSYAMDHGFILVTNNIMDFRKLYARHSPHPGLICLTLDRDNKSRGLQRRLFGQALDALAEDPGDTWRLDIRSDGPDGPGILRINPFPASA